MSQGFSLHHQKHSEVSPDAREHCYGGRSLTQHLHSPNQRGQRGKNAGEWPCRSASIISLGEELRLAGIPSELPRDWKPYFPLGIFNVPHSKCLMNLMEGRIVNKRVIHVPGQDILPERAFLVLWYASQSFFFFKFLPSVWACDGLNLGGAESMRGWGFEGFVQCQVESVKVQGCVGLIPWLPYSSKLWVFEDLCLGGYESVVSQRLLF